MYKKNISFNPLFCLHNCWLDLLVTEDSIKIELTKRVSNDGDVLYSYTVSFLHRAALTQMGSKQNINQLMFLVFISKNLGRDI